MRLVALSFLLCSCVINHYGPRAAQKAVSSPSTGVTLVCDADCTEAEKSRIKAIEAKLNETLNSSCFANYILAGGRQWHEMGKETPISLLLKMRSRMVLMVSYFYSDEWYVLGFEQAGEPVVHINRNSLARLKMGLCQEAAIAAHEAAHAQGFMHRGNVYNDYNSWSTAPYIVNHAFESRSEDYRNGGCCLD